MSETSDCANDNLFAADNQIKQLLRVKSQEQRPPWGSWSWVGQAATKLFPTATLTLSAAQRTILPEDFC
jgi:hypothetical protein